MGEGTLDLSLEEPGGYRANADSSSHTYSKVELRFRPGRDAGVLSNKGTDSAACKRPQNESDVIAGHRGSLVWGLNGQAWRLALCGFIARRSMNEGARTAIILDLGRNMNMALLKVFEVALKIPCNF
ncbi:hypothetical protein GCM10028785_19710 [Hydrogenophaga soli]